MTQMMSDEHRGYIAGWEDGADGRKATTDRGTYALGHAAGVIALAKAHREGKALSFVVQEELGARIANLVRRFNSVLQDPQPGLISWLEMRNRLAGELYEALGLKLGTTKPTDLVFGPSASDYP